MCLRQMLATHKELAAKLAELETRIESHDENTTALFEGRNGSWNHFSLNPMRAGSLILLE